MKNVHKLLVLFAIALIALLGVTIIFPRLYFWSYFVIIVSVVFVLLATLVFLIRRKQWRNYKLYVGALTIMAVLLIGTFLSPKRMLQLNFYLHKDTFTQEMENAINIAKDRSADGWAYSLTVPSVWTMENSTGLLYKKQDDMTAVWMNGIAGLGKMYCITYLSDAQAEQFVRNECIDFEWIEEGQWAYTTIR